MKGPRTRRKHFKIDELPDELRAAVLDRYHGGSTYAEITEFIKDSPQRPVEISVSPAAVARYGADFTARFERYRINLDKVAVLARELDTTRLAEGGSQLILHQILERLMDTDPEELAKCDPIALMNAYSEAQRSMVLREKLNIQRRDEKRKIEEREEKKAKAKAEADAAFVREKGGSGGLSEDTIREIEERILGVKR